MAAINPACAAPACSYVVPGPPDNAFEEFLASADREGRFLVEIDLFPNDAAPLTRPSLPACGAPACSIADPTGVISEPVQLKLSDHPVLMEPDDSLRPNYSPEARLAQRVDIDTAFSIVPNSSQASQVFIGDVELLNADGWVDQWINDYSVDGRRVRILFGPESGSYSEFRVIEEAFGQDWRGDQSEVRLTVQDLQFRLDQPYETATFRGTGGIEGTSNLSGVLKPRLIGHRWNFTPILIDPANDVWMVSNSPLQEIVEVRDGGELFTFSGVDASAYGTLISASLNEGEWAWSSNLGLLRLRPAGGALASVLSIEARGDTTDGYVETAGDLIVRELRNRSGFSDTDIDAGSFGALNGFNTGYYFDGSNDALTFRQVFNDLTKQANARLIADSRIRAIRIVDPANATFNFELSQDQILDIEPEGAPFPPIIKTVVKYRPNDTRLSAAQIVGATNDLKDDLQKDFLETEFEDGSVALRHLGAQKQIIIETDLFDQASAIDLAAAVGAVWRSERKIFKVLANREALFFTVGSIVKVTHPRYGFAAGRNALIVSRFNNYNDQQAELRVLV